MKKALIQMHIAVFLWGFTGVLGRAISVDAFPMVWYRTFLTSLIFLVLLFYFKEFKKVSRKEILRFMLIGSIIAVHWVAFYGAIKYANASIALTCLSTAGIFTAVFEPLLTQSKFDYREIIVGLIALLGMYFIYAFDIHFGLGILLGLIAAVLSSVFTVMNKKIVAAYPSNLVAFYEIGSGFLFLTLLAPFYFYFMPQVKYIPTANDYTLLFILSFFCTVLGQSLAISALKKLSSFTTVLMVNLEPVYGIILAILFYHENKELNTGFYIGIGLIGFSVAMHTASLLYRYRRSLH